MYLTVGNLETAREDLEKKQPMNDYEAVETFQRIVAQIAQRCVEEDEMAALTTPEGENTTPDEENV